MKCIERISVGMSIAFAICGCSKSGSTVVPQNASAAVVIESAPKVAEAKVAYAEKPSFYTVDHYDTARNPADDLAKTVTRAKAEKKRILIQVGGDWCGWCKLMSRYI